MRQLKFILILCARERENIRYIILRIFNKWSSKTFLMIPAFAASEISSNKFAIVKKSGHARFVYQMYLTDGDYKYRRSHLTARKIDEWKTTFWKSLISHINARLYVNTCLCEYLWSNDNLFLMWHSANSLIDYKGCQIRIHETNDFAKNLVRFNRLKELWRSNWLLECQNFLQHHHQRKCSIWLFQQNYFYSPNFLEWNFIRKMERLNWITQVKVIFLFTWREFHFVSWSEYFYL